MELPGPAHASHVVLASRASLCYGHLYTGAESAVKAVVDKELYLSRALASAVLNEEMRNITGFHFEYDRENKIFNGKFHDPVTDKSIRTYYRLAAIQVAGADFRGGITDFSSGISFDVTQQGFMI